MRSNSYLMSDYVYTVSIAVQRAFSQALVHYTVVLVSGDESAGAEPSKASRAERGHARHASLRFSSNCLNSTPARNLKTSITSAVRTAARSISRTAAGSSVASPAPSRSCAWLPRLRQTKKPSPISRPGKPSCRSERSA